MFKNPELCDKYIATKCDRKHLNESAAHPRNNCFMLKLFGVCMQLHTHFRDYCHAITLLSFTLSSYLFYLGHILMFLN